MSFGIRKLLFNEGFATSRATLGNDPILCKLHAHICQMWITIEFLPKVVRGLNEITSGSQLEYSRSGCYYCWMFMLIQR